MTSSPHPAPRSSPAGPDDDSATGRMKWSRGKLAGAIGGGCCGLLLLAFIAITILGLIIGPDENTEPETTPTTVEETEAPETEEPADETTTETEPTDEPTTEPEVTEEATEEETEEVPAEDDPQAWAAAVEETALIGSADWQEFCGGDYSLGTCWITDVSADYVGTLDVTLQLTGNDAEAQQLAEGAANTIFATAGTEHDDLEWVVVYGADGVVIDQKKRSDYPLLN